MSPFRREVLHIGLEGTGATLVKVAGGRRPRVLADRHVPFTLDPRAPALAGLAECLADPAFGPKRARVVLADTLVRYFVAARPQGVRSLAELRSLIEARFEEQFGLPAADWNIVGDLDPRAGRYLACAVPRSLNDALRSLPGLQLLSVQPYAVSEINRWRARVPGGPSWFAAVSPQAVTLGYWNKHGWQGVRTHAGPAGTEPPVEDLAARDSLLHGVEQTAPIACSGMVGQPVSVAAKPDRRTLGAGLWPGRGEAWSRTYRTALSGVWP